jgi:NTE family protein
MDPMPAPPEAADPRGKAPDQLEDELRDDRQLRQPPPPVPFGLALSGGGIRATLFHLGAIWRINEMGKLRVIDRITSVSGGSFASGLLALRWKDLEWDGRGRATNLGELFAKPVLRLARLPLPLDAAIVALGIVPGIQPAQVLGEVLDRFFFGGFMLADLPDKGQGPLFVFNATELSSGTDWRFSKPYMGSYRVGLVDNPHVRVADAVAASAAFPPLVSPLTLRIDPAHLRKTRGADLHDEVAQAGRVALTDGGAYDNMGLSPIMRRCQHLLVSDAGGSLGMESEDWKWQLWSLQTKRILDIAVSQERAQRRRALIVGAAEDRPVAYWRTLTDPADFEKSPTPFVVKGDWRTYLAGRPTRLAPFPDDDRRWLVNWGYLVSDMVLRAFIWKDAKPPQRLPFPDNGFEAPPPSEQAVAGYG